MIAAFQLLDKVHYKVPPRKWKGETAYHAILLSHIEESYIVWLDVFVSELKHRLSVYIASLI